VAVLGWSFAAMSHAFVRTVAGMFAAKFTGHVLQWTHSYVLLFGGASVAYLLALIVIQVLNPRLEPMKIGVTGKIQI